MTPETGGASVRGADVARTIEEQRSSSDVVRQPGEAERKPEAWARRRRLTNLTLAWAVPLILLVLWEVGARTGFVDIRFFASPSTIARQASKLISSGELASHVWISAQRVVYGYILGSVAGILVGLLLGQFRILRVAFEPLLHGLYVVPKLALLPLLLLLFGIGETPKIAFVTLGVFFIMAISTLSGALMVSTGYLEVARSFSASRRQMFRHVIFPATLPHIAAALKLSSGIAVLLMMAVEFLASNDGIGYLTWHSWTLFLADRMYVGIVTVAIFGVLFSGLVKWLTAKAIPWAEQGEQMEIR